MGSFANFVVLWEFAIIESTVYLFVKRWGNEISELFQVGHKNAISLVKVWILALAMWFKFQIHL